MRLIARTATIEQEIRKSRFIATVTRVEDEGEARAVIEATRKAHWSANHTCSAWRIGAEGSLQRSNDDGEPGGSAGVPMLTALQHRDVTNVVATVTRYFGGTKLGVGGLIRAYGGAVSSCLDEAGIVEPVTLTILRAELLHADAGRFEHALRASAFGIDEVAYNAAHVAFDVALRDHELDAFRAFVADFTSGAVTPRDVGTRSVDVPADLKAESTHR